MKRLRQLDMIRRLTFSMLLILPATLGAQTRPPIVEEMVKTYGLDSFDQIEAIRYTFNIEVPAIKLKLSRSWVWEPKAGRVSYDGTDKEGKPVKVTYLCSELSKQHAFLKDVVDPSFMNDQYWLVFPFHVYWDAGAKVEDTGMQKLPLGKGFAEKVAVIYPSDGGYTPGDTWTLFVGPDKRVKEFIYHRGGSQRPTLVVERRGQLTTTWAGYKKAGPLLVSTDHRGSADGKPARIFFTDVAVKMVGSNDWVDAK